VHAYSLVHDDLPAMDDDDLRRGKPTVHKAWDEATAILAGDALLAEAFRLALTAGAAVAGELVEGTVAMIGGQWLDIRGDGRREQLHRLKTGALFSASVGCALAALDVPRSEQRPWREFAEELGLLFQYVDDILDDDGVVLDVGADDARRLADGTAERAHALLTALETDTSVLEEIVDGLASRTA
jgi:geranylgeranyl pyrophosphate synthase